MKKKKKTSTLNIVVHSSWCHKHNSSRGSVVYADVIATSCHRNHAHALFNEHARRIIRDYFGPWDPGLHCAPYGIASRREEAGPWRLRPVSGRMLHSCASIVFPWFSAGPSRSLSSPAQCVTHFGYVMRDIAHRTLSRMADVLVVVDELPLVSDPSFDPSVGPSFTRHAEKEGHRVHATPKLTESWVRSLPNWILLAVFDVWHGSECVSLTSELATRLFVERTVTKIVFHVSASVRHIHGAEAATVLMSLGYKVQLLSAHWRRFNRTSCSP